MSELDPDDQREQLLAHWDRRASGWAKRADSLRELGMGVSIWMIEHLELQPGQDVLELAAGPGDTGFLAAEMIAPGGELICSDASEAMLEVARARSSAQAVNNVEFKRLELEWIDLPTASVDAVLCRWGLMLVLVPAAALLEIRRVLRPGGRVALAVWDEASRNPWATTPTRALLTLGHAQPPDPNAPGMFALAAPGKLTELLDSAGFTDVLVEGVAIERARPSIDEYIAEQLELSLPFDEAFEPLSAPERERVREEITELASPFVAEDGAVSFPGRSLVALAYG